MIADGDEFGGAAEYVSHLYIIGVVASGGCTAVGLCGGSADSRAVASRRIPLVVIVGGIACALTAYGMCGESHRLAYTIVNFVA